MWLTMAMCDFELCDRPSDVGGLCRKHYDQRRRGNKLTPIDPITGRLQRVRKEPEACGHPGCNNVYSRKGYCATHATHFRDYGETYDVKPGTKRRSSHGEVSHYNNYGCRCELCAIAHRSYYQGRKSAEVYKSASTGQAREDITHGVYSSYASHGCRCDMCRAAAAKDMGERRRVKLAVPEGAKEERDGVCDCCGKRARRLVLDHDHSTDMFRGFLCDNCNTGIGKLGDSIEGVSQALLYLSSTQQ